MGAKYDSYNYKDYWKGRDYEHNAEVLALQTFLNKIPKIQTIIDIGAGFGRLAPVYAFRAKKVFITEPSAKLLAEARENLQNFRHIEFIQAGIDKLEGKIPKEKADLVILVRVIHHLTNLASAFRTVNYLLKPGGFFILEFANKLHIKAVAHELLNANWDYLSALTPKDMRTKAAIKRGVIPFLNHHPRAIRQALESAGFVILEKLSVSNLRSDFAKKYLTPELLSGIEPILQKPLSVVDFGPSIFLLCQKRV